MIQTKQTVLLWLAAILPASLFKVAIANTAEVTETGIFADGAFTIGESAFSLSAYLLAAGVAIATSLLYKNRALQVKAAWATFGIFLIGIPAAIYMAVKGSGAVPSIAVHVIIAISLLLTFLAVRFIKKDIAIVKSMDRLR